MARRLGLTSIIVRSLTEHFKKDNTRREDVNYLAGDLINRGYDEDSVLDGINYAKEKAAEEKERGERKRGKIITPSWKWLSPFKPYLSPQNLPQKPA